MIESNIWKWLSDNIKYISLMVVAIVFFSTTTYMAIVKARNANTLRMLEVNTEKITKKANELTTTMKSLTLKTILLQEKLKAKKVQEKDNIKNYILTYYKTVAPVIAEEAAVHILEKSAKHNVPFVAVVAVMEVESHFNPFAISKKGARGLMQIMPRFWLEEFKLTNKYQLHDIETNVDCGVRILRKYLDITDNNMRKALYKYVGGDHSYINNVYKSMGKFIVFKSFTDIRVSEEENEKSMVDIKVRIDNEAVEVKTVTKAKSNVLFRHIIRKGQTLGLLAQWYTGSVNNWKKISKVNPTITPNIMPVGSIIVIPTNLLKNTTPLQ